ncbi:MarR family winged helix-turn-helix transcriptional regulator [Cuneatibacter caecimuris]|uniref:MarR family transcriptional regulator n=1 Tax=Cuneatibacter caecimuris TaxID=1796618 RepID=A0A4Q7PNL1_9FIRM|nr:MarR family transcriptional regulator [Cuneatibacter caecimuris]RZT02561.1 MarR family transcriptional regulator [Cuneatibacter caecimuris]
MKDLDTGTEQEMQNMVNTRLHQLFRRMFGHWFEINRELHIHPGQVGTLQFLKEKPGVSQRKMAEHLQVKPSTVSVTLKRMEARGLLIRRPDEKDRRNTRIFLTEEGEIVVKQLDEKKKQVEAQMFRGFSKEEYGILEELLGRMKDNLEKG